jgi:hypothetical protein
MRFEPGLINLFYGLVGNALGSKFNMIDHSSPKYRKDAGKGGGIAMKRVIYIVAQKSSILPFLHEFWTQKIYS